ALILYLSYGDRHNVLVGQLRDLLDYVVRKSEKSEKYDQIHIVAYSFGTIIALDALMPPQMGVYQTQGDGTRARFHKVDSITTIGSPFDFIRNFWPDYFLSRTKKPIQTRWINIYAPDDIFGSNFRDDDQIGSAEIGITTTLLSVSQDRVKSKSEKLGKVRRVLRQHAKSKSEKLGRVRRVLRRWLGQMFNGFTALRRKASKVADPEEQERPKQNLALITRIRPKGLSSLFDIFTLMGIRSHMVYWETVDDPQINCFDLLINALYDDKHPFLPRSQETDTK
ncbi:MAG: hypothetical protein WCG26_14290, partial [Chloroflexales bacterium]